MSGTEIIENDTDRAGTPGVAADLAAIRASGGWLPWTGLVLALAWWAAAGAAVLLTIGLEAALAAGPAIALTGALLILLPGLMLILATSLAAENLRSARANALVLRAAGQLLAPARTLSGETATLAAATQLAGREIEQAMARAVTAVRGVSKEIGDERLRIENVSYACADNARDLAARLSEERRALETLARELRVQTEALSDAIPRQAELMVASAREAAAEVGAADDALEARLASLTKGGEVLRHAMAAIDRLVAETGARQERLAGEIARLGGSLDESRALTEQAVRASDMATAAARDTAETLRLAVAHAIETAHKAARSIQAETRAAVELAGKTLADLRQPDRQADRAAPLRSLPEATAQADMPRPAPVDEIAPAHHTPLIEDLFEADADADAPPASLPLPSGDPAALKPVIRLPEPAPPPPRAEPSPEPLTGNGASLRDILADIDRVHGGAAGVDSGVEIVARLQSSGIGLPDIFRARDGRKLANAARRGDSALRRTVLDLAGSEVQRVAARLQRDGKLLTLARDFLSQDAELVLGQLTAGMKSEEAASPRLSAYLLVDAALNTRAS